MADPGVCFSYLLKYPCCLNYSSVPNIIPSAPNIILSAPNIILSTPNIIPSAKIVYINGTDVNGIKMQRDSSNTVEN